jgi:hypothetical protein
MKDELRPEYDLKSLRVGKVGPERQEFGKQASDKQDARQDLSEATQKERYPFWGKPITYLNPTDPVAEEDWEVLQ